METLKLLPFSPANVEATVRPLSQASVRVTVFGLLLPGSATAGAATRSPPAIRPKQDRHSSAPPFLQVTPSPTGVDNSPRLVLAGHSDSSDSGRLRSCQVRWS